ncbi:alpha/beta hydrolase [Mycobacterium sp. CBMA293]|uniref:alpha/beta hydrolase n=1 Tax=unclassified Mycolicibacterium TaxID=2636767 RepID=UPI0012DF1EE5|nr:MULTISPECIES: alpha/beta hydrolase [unclassified Mycolicibacterium]MUL50013.1 alpha/beta hydrolase [Mycolicibacterium sp. CBMA 360]MUL92779.1 alpha/beta hydrolase [Mycolicibacterium sp. CBMA 230]MUM32072.1 alpha/beta hydrolase [Mycolicibacterium sp. CBMA 361]MUL61933.1 alpha/beta hydrolase [Mycolicibacterium sp. CBMA 335]MUL72584.1 alpha/beta hydrolase [Mycolicibacterium sp. CBMA 311]
MTSAERINEPAERGTAYAGPEWMGKANWHSVAETYLLKAMKPLLFLMTRVMLAINKRFPQVLLNRAYDGSERVMGWVPAAKGSRTEKVQLPNCPAEWVWNETTPPVDGRVVIYFHGSAFIALGINSHRPLVSNIARDSRARALSVAYRLCPRNLVEDAVDDGVDAYRYVLAQGVKPENIVLAGDSAGGFIAAMTAVAVRDLGLTQPAGCVLLSAATDSDMTPKYEAAARIPDATFPIDFLRMISEVFLLRNGARGPIPSPVDADLHGLGPFLLQVGSEEALRPDSELMAERLAEAGVAVQLQVFDRGVHVFQAFAFSNPDARRAIKEIAAFVDSVA